MKALSAGTRLGPYEILTPLGAGGMGEVYRARDSRLERDVAIKVLPADSSADPDRLRRFEQESKAAGALNHPNLLAVFDTGVYEAGPYIVFELLQGETLRQRLAPGPLPTRKAVEWAIQIAHGLAAAHQAGIVHRDLKPENLFLTTDGRAKVLDFGLAKLHPSREEVKKDGETQSEITGAGTVLGTTGYMSPEQVEGKPADQRSDVFSFGSVFYEMLSGRRAFARDSAVETMRAILKEDPAELTGVRGHVGVGLRQIVRRCLEKQPDARFQSAQDVAFALEAVSGAGAGFGFEVRSARGRRLAVLACFGLLGIAAWLRPAAPRPRVTSNPKQITSDLVEKFGPVTDGSRIYFNEMPRDGIPLLSQVAASGGEVGRIVSSLWAPTIVDVSPDGSEVLVVGHREAQALASTPEVWIVPVVGGSPRRVGDLRATDMAWSPDGRSIAYVTGAGSPEVFVARIDGSDVRKIWTAAGQSRWPAWSPDGRRLRVTVFPKGGTPSLWEVGADGQDGHPLLPALKKPAIYGRWTPDGRYFVFSVLEDRTSQIWVLRERTSWLSLASTEPVPLTHGPLTFANPVPSRDGRKIFAVGEKQRGELVRYDRPSGQFVPFLSGIPAHTVEFSRDDQWVAYVTYPEGTLWRSRADGSERLQLTEPPLRAGDPHWSPDGKRLVFWWGMWGGSEGSSYSISADGGRPVPVPMPDDQAWVANSWSPDGGTLALWKHRGSTNPLQLLDLKTGRFSTVHGSEGLFDPHWSTDGRQLVALSRDCFRLLLYDFATSGWRELLAGKQLLGWPRWSRDGRSVFVNQGSARVRLRVADGRQDVVASFEDLRIVTSLGNWVGRAPDDAVITLRDLSLQEIYALDWEAP